MPNFDRKGPNGDGPMSGGRRGRCNQANANSNFDRPRRGGGRGLGNGRDFKQNNSDNFVENHDLLDTILSEIKILKDKVFNNAPNN